MAHQSRSTRREFLRGKAALEAISELPDRWLPAPENTTPENTAAGASGDSPRDGAAYLIQIARDAMACEFQVFLNAGQHQGATEAALTALDRIEQLEDQLSVYRSHTELSRINQLAAQQEVVVERQLFELLERCMELHKQTDGAFDITAGPLSKVWGFHRRAGRFPAPEQLQAALRLVGSQLVQLSAERKAVRFAEPGVEINLNAIGKGYALDRAAEVLLDNGVTDFLIHGGSSSLLARGARHGLGDERCGWSVALRHPLRHEQPLAEVWLHDQALGTSGSGNQFFHFQGKRYGHVIDPRSGYPAAALLSATVLAASAAIADALSTAAFVMGVEQTVEFCRQRSDLAVLLVEAGPRAGSIVLHTEGLPEDAWRRLDGHSQS